MGDFDQNIFTQMRLCSFDLECPDFQIDFKEKGDQKPLLLYKLDNGIEAYFVVPSSKDYFLTMRYEGEKYKLAKQAVMNGSIGKFVFYLLLIALISVLFSLYALSPMKRAIVLIEEFIKDILHDFNTPMSSIILNSALLESDDKNRQNIFRIQQSAQQILRLEENLKSYLGELQTQKEIFDLVEMLRQEQKCLQKVYSAINWKIEGETIKLYTSKVAFSRIISNILENAAKYNKRKGNITIKIDSKNRSMKIIDTGLGIENPEKIFERFYSEHDRGTGIGLHIVKKLAKELNILIEVESSIGKGSSFQLSLKELTNR